MPEFSHPSLISAEYADGHHAARIVAETDICDAIAEAAGPAGIRRLERDEPDIEDVFLSYYHEEATS
jgi:ABC-2 type transport system ATP-binding protein